MNQYSDQLEIKGVSNNLSENTNGIAFDASTVQNAVLKRLIEEVQNEGVNYINAYNRTHSRHNRGR